VKYIVIMSTMDQQLTRFQEFLNRNAEIYNELISPVTNQAYRVSDRIELRPSSHGGTGVFARQRIQEGEVVVYYTGTYAHNKLVKSQDNDNLNTSHALTTGFENPKIRSGMVTDGRSYAYYIANQPPGSSEHVWASGAMMNSSADDPSQTNVNVIKSSLLNSPVISASEGPLPAFHIELDDPNVRDFVSFGYALSAVTATRDIMIDEELMFNYFYEPDYKPKNLSMLLPPERPTKKPRRVTPTPIDTSMTTTIDSNRKSNAHGQMLSFPTIFDLKL
jgi:hypothetical protein